MCLLLVYKNVFAFCVLIVYLLNLLSSLISSRSFFCKLLEIFYIANCHLQIGKDFFLSSFLFSFFSSFYLYAFYLFFLA